MSSPSGTDRGSGLVYLPALDGLRAVAVGAVFLLHSGVVSGGFIGVDVFFVISGFLITGLAVAEVERTHRLSIGGFWARRAPSASRVARRRCCSSGRVDRRGRRRAATSRA